MKNSYALVNTMRLGRVYRRQDLESLSTAVDRDLKALLDDGKARKLAYGLYCRTHEKGLGARPLAKRELIRAFLKTDDFLLIPDMRLTGFGLDLAPKHDNLVYNHKRSGDRTLEGTRFQFRIVPAYPKKPGKEYLLVDLLNNLRKRPEHADLVLRNLRSRLHEFDEEKLRVNLERYGRPAARTLLKRVAFARRAAMPVRIVGEEDPRADLSYWLGKTPAERVDAMEFLRGQYYALSGRKTLPRLAHVVRIAECRS